MYVKPVYKYPSVWTDQSSSLVNKSKEWISHTNSINASAALLAEQYESIIQVQILSWCNVNRTVRWLSVPVHLSWGSGHTNHRNYNLLLKSKKVVIAAVYPLESFSRLHQGLGKALSTANTLSAAHMKMGKKNVHLLFGLMQSYSFIFFHIPGEPWFAFSVLVFPD